MYEVHDYIKSYLGETDEAHEFAKSFLDRRQKIKPSNGPPTASQVHSVLHDNIELMVPFVGAWVHACTHYNGVLMNNP